MNMFKPAEKQGWMNQSWRNLKACWHRENQSNCREPNAPQPCLSYVHGLGKAPVHKANAADVTRQRHPCVTRQRFWDIGQLMGTWHSHTGRIEFKERWRKTVRTVWNDKFDAGYDNAKHSGARSATPATQNEGECRQVPRLREAKVDVAKCHSCQAKYRGITGDWRRPSAPPEVPRLPRKTKVNVPKCRASHVKRRFEDGSRQAPRLPRKVPRRHGRLTATKCATRPSPVQQAPRLPRKTKVDAAKCHACDAKRRLMSASATPARQNEGRCETKRLPLETKMSPSATPATQSMSPSATPAMQNDGRCRQVLRLPRKGPRHAKVPRLPRKDGDWIVCDKAVCERWCVWQRCVCVWKMVCDQVVCERWRVTKVWRWCARTLCVKDGVCVCVCENMWKMVCYEVVCERLRVCVWQSCVCVCVSKLYGKVGSEKVVCDKVVCERWRVTIVCGRWCVTKLCVTKLCVCEQVVRERWGVRKWCVTKLCEKDGVWQSGGGGWGGGGRDTESKTITPHKDVGNKQSATAAHTSCPSSPAAATLHEKTLCFAFRHPPHTSPMQQSCRHYNAFCTTSLRLHFPKSHQFPKAPLL